MGTGICLSHKPVYVSKEEIKQGEGSSEWKIFLSSTAARKKFELDGTLPTLPLATSSSSTTNKTSRGRETDDRDRDKEATVLELKERNASYLELRAILDEPVAQRAIGKYAKELHSMDVFMCWIDIQEYKSIPTEDYRRSKGLHIFHKYIKEGAVLQIHCVDIGTIGAIRQELELHTKSNKNSISLPLTLYNEVQFMCFENIHNKIFLNFKASFMYQHLLSVLKHKYNFVKVDDFEYFEKLGEGGFGVVIHCMKKSTRRHYAMKIQTKNSILRTFDSEPWRVLSEIKTLAKCQHPFIINLDYAFHTENLTMLVLGLATGGDLAALLKASPHGRLDAIRVCFYTSQIVLALGYLHQLGLMYRDLKPENILLTADGNVQLVDMGGARCDADANQPIQEKDNGLMLLVNGTLDNSDNNSNKLQNKSSEEKLVEKSIVVQKDRKPRRLSVMGTFGYMAPEMLKLLSMSDLQYSNAVDWWSLGVTIFKLLTGKRPFNDKKCADFITLMSEAAEGKPVSQVQLGGIFSSINFPDYVPKDAQDLVSKLCDANERNRLGAKGVHQIKEHVFFKDVKWDLLEQKHVEPPYKPLTALTWTDMHPRSYQDVLHELNERSDFTAERPKDEHQRFFDEWNFTSSQTLRIEFGVAHEMEQYDKSFKARQIMGSPTGGGV